ncbi:MAG: hypothetical protein HFG93_10715 [Dorea sp.]|jgi:DNA-directed RNA polymerase subunit RPC12/RpoP|nr:hypothetical protein [Dorea sp.]
MAAIKCTKCGTKIENITSGIIQCPKCKHKMKYVPKKSNTNVQTSKNTIEPQKTKEKSKEISKKKENIKKNDNGNGCLGFIVILILIAVFSGKGCHTDNTHNDKKNANIPHRENMYGISDKDIDDINWDIIVENVRNDTTGKWKLVKIADNINIEKYALSYYDKYFESDDEIHAIVNFNYNTTTKLSVFGDKLDVEVHEYVDKEEHDANILYSGMVYENFQIYLDNGDIEKIGMDSTSSEENINDDATSENFVNAIRNLEHFIDDQSIMDIKLENRDLCVYIDLNKSPITVNLPIEKKAILTSITLGDNILTLNGYDNLWDTITFDFGDIGKIVNSKNNMESTETGRYFVGNPVLEQK